jgi:hypothetical protein
LHARPGGTEPGRLEYHWSALWPGSYRLDVSLDDFDGVLFSASGIEIAGARHNRDPRLDAIDLRGKVRGVRVQVLDPEGGRLQRARVLIDKPGPGERRGAETEDGVATILTPEAAVDLVVVVEGYPPKYLAGVRGDLQVTMAPFQAITLRLAGARSIPTGCSLRLYLEEKDVPHDTRGLLLYGRPLEQSGAFDRRGELTLPIGCAGTYGIRLELSNDATGRSYSVAFGPTEIDVPMPTAGLVDELSVPDEGWERALRLIRLR